VRPVGWTHASRGSDLAPDAGQQTQGSAADPSDDAIAEELRAQNGNVLGSAQSLGVHRGKIRRWIARNPELWKEILASLENKIDKDDPADAED
jgi:hypothetical protein